MREANGERTTEPREDEILGVEILEPLPQVAVRRSTAQGEHTIFIEGLTIEAVIHIEKLGSMIETIGDTLGPVTVKDGRCVITKTTNPDGSTVETKYCPPPPK